MNKIGVFYGSTTGTTEDLARRIAEKLDVPSAHVFDVSKLTEALVNEYDVLVLGSSTWGAGELQDDWYDGVKVLKKCDLSHKSVALFGCGDSDSYSDTFCDAIGILYEDLKDTHCKFRGATDTAGYTFDSSIAVVDGKFVGLPLDEVNEDNKTDERINKKSVNFTLTSKEYFASWQLKESSPAKSGFFLITFMSLRKAYATWYFIQ